jgi:hypothetical protein
MGASVVAAADGSVLDPSGAAKSDGDPVAVRDDRDVSASLGEREHPLERRRVVLHVDILELDAPPCMVVTGGRRVRSGVLAEDVDHGSLRRNRQSVNR